MRRDDDDEPLCCCAFCWAFMFSYREQSLRLHFFIEPCSIKRFSGSTEHSQIELLLIVLSSGAIWQTWKDTAAWQSLLPSKQYDGSDPVVMFPVPPRLGHSRCGDLLTLAFWPHMFPFPLTFNPHPFVLKNKIRWTKWTTDRFLTLFCYHKFSMG